MVDVNIGSVYFASNRIVEPIVVMDDFSYRNYGRKFENDHQFGKFQSKGSASSGSSFLNRVGRQLFSFTPSVAAANQSNSFDQSSARLSSGPFQTPGLSATSSNSSKGTTMNKNNAPSTSISTSNNRYGFFSTRRQESSDRDKLYNETLAQYAQHRIVVGESIHEKLVYVFTGLMERGQCNLEAFIKEVQRDDLLRNTLDGNTRNQILYEIQKLNTTDAYKTYIGWYGLMQALDQNTRLDFSHYLKPTSLSSLSTTTITTQQSLGTPFPETIGNGTSPQMDDQARSRERYHKFLEKRGVDTSSLVQSHNQQQQADVSPPRRSSFNASSMDVMESRLSLYDQALEDKRRLEKKVADIYARGAHKGAMDDVEARVDKYITTREDGGDDDDFMELEVRPLEGEEEDEQDGGKVKERLSAVSDEDLAQVLKAFSAPDDSIVANHSIEMKARDFRRLQNGVWLNDEIVNFYMGLLQDRDTALCDQDPNRRKSHFFSSMFMDKLMNVGNDKGYEYANVRRWSRKFDIFEMDKVVFPVNISNSHWTLAVLYVQEKRICYYDSMNGNGDRYLTALRRWLVDEAQNKKQMELDGQEYALMGSVENSVPQQNNGSDCGVFTIMAADFLSEDIPLQYSQQYMPMLRNKIGAAILNTRVAYSI